MKTLKLSSNLVSELIVLQTELKKTGSVFSLSRLEKQTTMDSAGPKCSHCSVTCKGACTSSCYGGFIGMRN